MLSTRQLLEAWEVDPSQGIRKFLPNTVIISFRSIFADADQDGILDKQETELLQRFRPYYRFSKNNGQDEQYPPTNPMIYIEHSLLRNSDDETDKKGIIRNWGTFSPNASLLLRVGCNGSLNISECSNLIVHHKRSRYHLQVEPSFHYGFDSLQGVHDYWKFVEESANVGLYGHVVLDPKGNYKIEYWQFYAYNNSDSDHDYDHAGDWEGINLVVDKDGFKIISISYFVHGTEIKFQMECSWGVTIPIADDMIEIRGDRRTDKCDAEIQESVNLLEGRENYLVRLYGEMLPDGSRQYTHPVVYIEYGTHASWPNEHGRWIGAPDHNGDSIHGFLTSTPPNLGEVTHPLSNQAKIIMRYNGQWA